MSALLHHNASVAELRISLHTRLRPHLPGAREHTYTVSGTEVWPDRPTRLVWKLVGMHEGGLTQRGRGRRTAETLTQEGYHRTGLQRTHDPEPDFDEVRHKLRAERGGERRTDCVELTLPESVDSSDALWRIAERAEQCKALLPLIEEWLLARCRADDGWTLRADEESCGRMLTVLNVLGHAGAQATFAHYLTAVPLDKVPRRGLIALGSFDNPTAHLLEALVALVPNGNSRRAPVSHRNFLLGVSALVGTALSLGPHDEPAHAALSNLSLAIVGQYEGMSELDARWQQLEEEVCAHPDSRPPQHPTAMHRAHDGSPRWRF